MALKTKVQPIPTQTISPPAIAGPTKRAPFHITELTATAAGMSSRRTSTGISDRRAGWPKAVTMPKNSVSRNRISGVRSEERREGKECVSTGRARWSTYHYKKKEKQQPMQD